MVGNRTTQLHPEEPSPWQVGGLRRCPSTGAQRWADTWRPAAPWPPEILGNAEGPAQVRTPSTAVGAGNMPAVAGRQGLCRRHPMSHARSPRRADAPPRSNGVGPERGPRYSAGMPGHVSAARVAVCWVPAQSQRPRVVDVAGQPVGRREGAIRCTQACYGFVARPLSNAPS